jgi:hypothetical protein
LSWEELGKTQIIKGLENGRPFGIVSVKEFGAVGDGITNDTTFIANAVSFINAQGGGSLYFPPGTYMVDDIALCSNILVFGHRYKTTIKLNEFVRGNCLTINDINNVQIRDISLDGNRENNESPAPSADSEWNGISILNSNNITIDNIWSHSNGYHGCVMRGVSNVKIKNSKFTNNGFRPFHGSLVHDSEFSFNECSDNGKGFAGGSGNIYDGIYFFNGIENVLIHGNRVLSANGLCCICVGGTVTAFGDEQGSKDITISNNICTSAIPTTVHGIELVGEQLNYVNVVGNIIYDSRFAIFVVSNPSTLGSTINISDNVIHNCSGGVIINATAQRCIISNNNIYRTTSEGIKVVNMIDSIISNNSISDVGAWTPTNSAIVLQGASLRNIITGNRVVNSIAEHYSKYGVNEEDTSDYNYIHDNFYQQMVLGGVNTIGINTVVRNDINI